MYAALKESRGSSLIQIRSSGIKIKEMQRGASLACRRKRIVSGGSRLQRGQHCISGDPGHGEYTVFMLVFTVHYRTVRGLGFHLAPFWSSVSRFVFRNTNMHIVPAGPMVPKGRDQHEMSLFPTFSSTMPSELMPISSLSVSHLMASWRPCALCSPGWCDTPTSTEREWVSEILSFGVTPR